MGSSLEAIFGELGISQYLDVFFDQGFDSWETILDITESDLDALGVKLGHRRKLQRRIANSRGLGPQISLVSPARISIEDTRPDAYRQDTAKADGRDGTTVMKRKYRRHPKPDENAPERPPSAYVLFSNKMRDDLKGRQLTFTEIAKLVGEHWQSLPRAERDPYETQAQDAKERYNRELGDYKKTVEYKKYSEYLQEFRKRQALQTQEKDAAKRLKTESDSNRASATSGSMGSNGSSSESQPGSEPPPTRQQRYGSITSEYAPSTSGIGNCQEDSVHPLINAAGDYFARGRPRGLSSPSSRESPFHSNSRGSWSTNGQRMSADATNAANLPWLPGSMDHRGTLGPIVQSPDNKSLPSLAPTQSHGSGSSHTSRSSASASASRPPSLKTEPSSTGSMSSLGSYNLPRTPSDASLPIHALLSSKPDPSYLSQQAPPPLMQNSLTQTPLSGFHQPSGRPPGDSSVSGRHSARSNEILPAPSAPSFSQPGFYQEPSSGGLPNVPKVSAGSRFNGAPDAGLDGISALLRARDIVDRRPN